MRIFLDGQVVSGNEAEVISPRTSGQCCQFNCIGSSQVVYFNRAIMTLELELGTDCRVC